MCLDKNIDDVLEQMKHCHDPKEKRRLLEKITPCKTCPEEKQSSPRSANAHAKKSIKQN